MEYIIIYTNDDEQIPHFHVSDNVYPNETSFDISLKITSPEYLRHVNHQYQELDKNILLKIFENLKNIWTHIIMTWNDNNSNQTIPYDTPIPDYMSLISE